MAYGRIVRERIVADSLIRSRWRTRIFLDGESRSQIPFSFKEAKGFKIFLCKVATVSKELL